MSELPQIAHVYVGANSVREVYQVREDPSLSCEMVIAATSAAMAVAEQIELDSWPLRWKDEARDINVLASRILIPESHVGPFDLVLVLALIACIVSLRIFL